MHATRKILMPMPNQAKYAHEMSSKLPAHSLFVSTELHRTRFNGEPPEVDRLYLQLTGTPEAFRFLATLLLELASNADSSVILDPSDLKHLTLTYWSAIDIACRTEIPKCTPKEN